MHFCIISSGKLLCVFYFTFFIYDLLGPRCAANKIINRCGRGAFRTCEVDKRQLEGGFPFPSYPFTPLTIPWRTLHAARLFLQGVFSRNARGPHALRNTHIYALESLILYIFKLWISPPLIHPLVGVYFLKVFIFINFISRRKYNILRIKNNKKMLLLYIFQRKN